MNFLGHLYIDSAPSPYYNLGLLTPDFLYVFQAKNKINYKILDEMVVNETVVDFFKGILRHKTIDHFFHTSNFFEESTSKMKVIIEQTEINPSGKFNFMLAHVGVELLLDKAALDSNPVLANGFYKDLEQIDVPQIEKIMQEITRRSLNEGFSQFLLDVLHRKKLNKYNQISHLAAILHDIFTKKPFENHFTNNPALFEKLLEKSWEELAINIENLKQYLHQQAESN